MRRAGDVWQPMALIDELKVKARAAGLWNMFLPHPYKGQGGISNLDYAPLCEVMGRVSWSGEVFNCSAPDTGNMETLERYATDAQKERWLEPLLDGRIRSAFLMTEPAVASSDATNIQCSITRDGDHYVINGRKWFSSGAGNPRCAIFIVMGKTDPEGPRHAAAVDGAGAARHPWRDGAAPAVGVRLRRRTAWPHGSRARQRAGAGGQHPAGRRPRLRDRPGRLGPGRIHHCMRSIGAAERALEMMVDRLQTRIAFGKALSEQSVWHERIAESRCMIDQARLLTLNAAHRMDTVGNKVARADIAMIKVVAPNMSCKVVDWAIQAHGGAGVSQDFWLAEAYAHQRTVRLVDGPDEVHRNAIAKIELAKRAAVRKSLTLG
jgi:acyl-CoA dehydrogenase